MNPVDELSLMRAILKKAEALGPDEIDYLMNKLLVARDQKLLALAEVACVGTEAAPEL